MRWQNATQQNRFALEFVYLVQQLAAGVSGDGQSEGLDAVAEERVGLGGRDAAGFT